MKKFFSTIIKGIKTKVLGIHDFPNPEKLWTTVNETDRKNWVTIEVGKKK